MLMIQSGISVNQAPPQPVMQATSPEQQKMTDNSESIFIDDEPPKFFGNVAQSSGPSFLEAGQPADLPVPQLQVEAGAALAMPLP